MNTINSISIPQTLSTGASASASASASAGAQGSSFKDYLFQSLQEVNTMQQQADHAVEQMMSGGEANPADVLTAVQKADIAFKMMMQIRNKLVSAYQEVQNIRI